MLKSIIQFSPTETVSREQAERHYSDIHIAMAQKLFTFHVDNLERYVPQRAVSQYDIAGGFNLVPIDAWRFVFLHYDSLPYIPHEWRDLVSGDHENCVEDIRSYVVDDERTMVDRRSGQMTSAKFVFSFGGQSPGNADLSNVISRIAEQFGSAPGARLLIVNDVSQKRKSEARARPGQQTTSLLEPSDVCAFVEFYFDHWRWGETFFAREDIRLDLLIRSGSETTKGYRVVEEIGYDRRRPIP